MQTYSDALKLIWQILIAFSGINFLIILLEKEVPLRTELETEFGLEGENKDKGPSEITADKDAERGEEKTVDPDATGSSASGQDLSLIHI